MFNPKITPIVLLVALLLVACTPTAISPPTDAVDTSPAATATAVAADTPSAETAATDADHDHEDEGMEETNTSTAGLNPDLFFDGALLEEPAIVDCTLSDGTETTCYAITIAGYPANYTDGPYCPPTIWSTAEEGGIWFDGNALYDLDGEFIVGLPELYNDPNWKLYDDDGNVRITETREEFEAAARPDVDPALQNHCVQGSIEWTVNDGPVSTTILIPTIPVKAERPSAGGNWGVTLNGVSIAASAPVDAILGAYTIAAFDDCGGHINPFDGYHLHGAMGCSEAGEAPEGETAIFAYALDGYPIHSPLDPEAEAVAELDECNGHITEAFGYHYHANPAQENSVLTCFMGLTVEGQGGRAGEGGPRGAGPPEGALPGGAIDLAVAAQTLGVSEHELRDALSDPPDFEAAAQTLGVIVEELTNALGIPAGGSQDGLP